MKACKTFGSTAKASVLPCAPAELSKAYRGAQELQSLAARLSIDAHRCVGQISGSEGNSRSHQYEAQHSRKRAHGVAHGALDSLGAYQVFVKPRINSATSARCPLPSTVLARAMNNCVSDSIQRESTQIRTQSLRSSKQRKNGNPPLDLTHRIAFDGSARPPVALECLAQFDEPLIASESLTEATRRVLLRV